jgi:hypothetical protein
MIKVANQAKKAEQLWVGRPSVFPEPFLKQFHHKIGKVEKVKL